MTAAATGADPACPAHLRARIVAHAEVAERTWRLRLECPALAARALPGQFAMLRIPDRDDPLLARPLAVYDVAPDEGERCHADFIYLVHGKFTRTLRTLRPGDEVAVWGPLGNGFHLPAVDHLLLVAGGIGQTALLALARERSGQARYGSPPRSVPRAGKITFCWGVRHAGLLAGPEDFRAAGCEVALATLDGSAGLRGTVIDLLDERCGGTAPAGSHVACCGPEPMMAAVAAWCAARGLPCAVSLETPMACGVGICFSCVAPIRDADGGWDYRRTCVEGPVFDARAVAW